MLVGDPNIFAIESQITEAYDSWVKPLPNHALGFFVLHIGGLVAGVKQPDATMLMNAVAEVAERLSHRGEHTFQEIQGAPGRDIASAFLLSVYAHESQRPPTCFGIEVDSFRDRAYKAQLHFTDGDEAFDDGTCVLHIDCGDSVRLIAATPDSAPHPEVPGCSTPSGRKFKAFSEVRLPEHQFYQILATWLTSFQCELDTTPKQRLKHEYYPDDWKPGTRLE